MVAADVCPSDAVHSCYRPCFDDLRVVMACKGGSLERKSGHHGRHTMHIRTRLFIP
jgi:hypothetical protein